MKLNKKNILILAILLAAVALVFVLSRPGSGKDSNEEQPQTAQTVAEDNTEDEANIASTEMEEAADEASAQESPDTEEDSSMEVGEEFVIELEENQKTGSFD